MLMISYSLPMRNVILAILYLEPTPPFLGRCGVVADSYLRRTAGGTRRPAGDALRLGRYLSRPWRRAVHRPPRPLRQDPGRLRARKAATRPCKPPKSLRSEYVDPGHAARSPRGPKGPINPKLDTGEIEVRAAAAGDPQQEPDAAVPADGQGPARRGHPAEVSLRRSAPAGDAADACCCGIA